MPRSQPGFLTGSWLDHDPRCRLAHVEVAGEVQVEMRLPLVGPNVEERAVFHHRRVADHHVDPRMTPQHLLEHRVDRRPTAGVAAEVLDRAAAGLGRLGDGRAFVLTLAAGHDDRAAFFAEASADGPADVAVAGRDHGHFSRHTSRCCHLRDLLQCVWLFCSTTRRFLRACGLWFQERRSTRTETPRPR